MRLRTAAELAGAIAAASNLTSPLSPAEYALEMVVRHPEYGLGKVVALEGTGERRQATVRFASAAGEKKFVLRYAALRPAQ